jgi:F-type H+-transporting ATPase subunit gamma
MKLARDIKRRMRTIGNTQQITRAMEAVSATKMRRSQEFALAARPYAESALRLLGNVSQKIASKIHPLLEKRRGKNVCLIVITSDKGLCGGYNGGVLRKAQEYLNNNLEKNIDIITVGKKARDYFKFRSQERVEEFIGFGDFVKLDETMPVAERVLQDWQEKKYSKIVCVFTNFVSTLRQESVVRQILPITKKGIEEIVEGIGGQMHQASDYNYKYLFEPSREKVLKELLPLLVDIQIHYMILEANASEHSARMMAMKNASENAEEILEELNLFYNKARQAAITSEITEVIAGREALE